MRIAKIGDVPWDEFFDLGKRVWVKKMVSFRPTIHVLSMEGDIPEKGTLLEESFLFM